MPALHILRDGHRFEVSREILQRHIIDTVIILLMIYLVQQVSCPLRRAVRPFAFEVLLAPRIPDLEQFDLGPIDLRINQLDAHDC